MSVAAVMLAKDEADVIGPVVRHLLANVDHVIVADNGSTDGTREILQAIQMGLANAGKSPRGRARGLWLTEDPEPAYFQSKKTTELAMLALEHGHDWVIPCDADEIWYADGRPLKEFLAGLAPDVMIVEAEMHHHIPTALDEPSEPDPEPHEGCEKRGGVCDCAERPCALDQKIEPNPFRRIGWRKRARAALPKVAARLRPDLVIEAGNHSVTVDGSALKAGGLHVRHFSWRSPEQYLRKIRNGAAAYAATDLPLDTGAHWRMWDEQSDEAILDHFRRWFYSSDPKADETLIYDPVTPLLGGP